MHKAASPAPALSGQTGWAGSSVPREAIGAKLWLAGPGAASALAAAPVAASGSDKWERFDQGFVACSATALQNRLRKSPEHMAISDPSDSSEIVAALVSQAMRELLDSMRALCNRLQDDSAQFCPDEFDRLGVLLPSMLGAAEELCRAADSLLLGSDSIDSQSASPATPYGELARSLVEARRLTKLALTALRPRVHQDADAVELINRVMARAAAFDHKSP